MKLSTCLLTLLAAAATACHSEGVGPQTGALRLDATIARSTIALGDTTSIVFHLRNLGADSVTLRFLNSCQILPYIATEEAEHMVYPSGGDWGCYEVLTSLTLAPGAEKTHTVLVRAGAQQSYPAVALLPGQYVAFARLDHPDYPLQSARLSLTVR